jgi:hypothetical protein
MVLFSGEALYVPGPGTAPAVCETVKKSRCVFGNWCDGAVSIVKELLGLYSCGPGVYG